MVAHLVSVLAPDSGHEGVKFLLLSWGQFEIVNRAALQTHEVVVMAGQPFGELITSKSIAVVHSEDSGLTHDRQRSIKRRQRNGAAQTAVEFSRRLRARRDLKRTHNCLTSARESDSVVGHPAPNSFGGFPFFHWEARDRVCRCESIMILIISCF